VLARFAVSVTLLWLLARYVDVAAVLARLSALSPAWVALGLAVSVLQVGVLAWRWRLTAARLGIDLPLRDAIGEYYLGIMLNQLLPGGVAGDVSRAWRHARATTTGQAVRAVILERASAQFVMTVVALVSVLLLPWAGVTTRAAVAAAVLLLGALALAGLSRRPASDSAAGRLLSDARQALLAPDAVATQLGSALVVVASYIAVFLIAALAVDTPTPLTSMLPLVAPVLMTMLIPVTIAGWGVREAAAAALWGLVGLTPEDGATISVAYGLLVLVASAPGLIILIRTLGAGRDRRERPPRA
jgi:uncharacterized membrane protein YbhN (UPF0104 family)